MIVVRNVFVATPGNASKLAAQLKQASQVEGMPSVRILTDLTGGFNRVIMEFEVADLAEFGARHEDYRTNEAVREAMQGYTELFQSGHRELLQVV